MGDVRSEAVDLSLLDPIYERYADQPGALIPMLQQAQEQYGYLPESVLAWIAERCGVSLGKVHGVATFYAQFALAPRAEHVLKLCDGTACHVKGSQKLLRAIADMYGIGPGEVTADGALTLETVYCLGSCALAPVAVLDGEIIGRMTPGVLLKAVAARLKADTEAVPRPLVDVRQGGTDDNL